MAADKGDGRRSHKIERETREMARAIVEHHFDAKPRRVVKLAGGITNAVYEVKHKEGDLVVRMSTEAPKIKNYLKEQWAMSEARKVGVPVPQVLEVGCEVVPLPYMVSLKSSGEEATHHPKRFKILKDMGRYTALIHTIPTSGFGHTFDWSHNQLSRCETWAEFLAKDLKVDERIAMLEKQKMLSRERVKRLRAIFVEIASWDKPPALNHGDMRLKNVIVDAEGHITAIIDWEFCVSSIAPYWDLTIALHDLSLDAMDCFLGGYGLSEAERREIAPALKAFNIIHYAPYIERSLAAGEDDKVEGFRTRLSGAFDLFSLN